MNRLRFLVGAMNAQQWSTHYVRHSLTLSVLLPVSFILPFTHPSLAPLCPAYSRPPALCSPCPLHHSVHPALPPTLLFPSLVWPGITPQRVVNGTTVCVWLLQESVCGLQSRRRKRQWVKDERQVPLRSYPPLLPSIPSLLHWALTVPGP